MSVGLQNKTSLLGFPQPGGMPIAPQEIRTSLMGNPLPILSNKGLGVKLHPAASRAAAAAPAATADAKANGGSVADGGGGGGKGVRNKGGAAGGGGGGGAKVNSGPLVNKSEVNGGANSSKFLPTNYWPNM